MERPLALRGHKRLYPDDDGGDEFGTDQSQEQSVVFVLFLISNNNSYLHNTTIHRQNKLVSRAFDSPRVLPKRQRSVLILVTARHYQGSATPRIRYSQGAPLPGAATLRVRHSHGPRLPGYATPQ